jgi:KDO2-lipid IV(A) lauroyltransferase
MPLWLGNWTVNRFGDAVWVAARRSRCAARSNMRHVLGPDAPERKVRRMARYAVRNALRNYYDLIRISHMPDTEFDRLVHLDKASVERVRKLAADEKGVLLVSAHWGVFDLLAHVMERQGISIMFLVAHFRPPELADYLTALRASRGSELVMIDEGIGALRRAMIALKTGRLVGIMPDRNVDRVGITIPFFGDDTVVGTGLAKLALRGNTPVVPGFCYRTGTNRYTFSFAEPIYPPREGDEATRIATLTQTVFTVIEHYISRAPDQWTLLQPVWPDAPCPPDPGLPPA